MDRFPFQGSAPLRCQPKELRILSAMQLVSRCCGYSRAVYTTKPIGEGIGLSM
jgi:hypothetical protein